MRDGAVRGLGDVPEEKAELVVRCTSVVEPVHVALAGPVCEEHRDADAGRIPSRAVVDERLCTGDVAIRG